MSNGFRFRVTRADGSEVQPVWMVLSIIAENGYRIIGGGVRDTARDGSFAWGTLQYVRSSGDRGEAFKRICDELGEECTNTELVPA